MQPIFLDDPAWMTTFPRRVTPLPDEWLPGLLHRCDEVNHWESRTALLHLLAPSKEKFHPAWGEKAPNLSIPDTMIVPGRLDLDHLAHRLAFPKDLLLATTYHCELAQIYEQIKPFPGLLSKTFSFRLCPACLAESRLLRRVLLLPYISLCPHHHLLLVQRCQCGTSLRLFSRRTAQPFACYVCGRDWADFPHIEGSAERVMLEQKLLAWYEFFFSKGTSEMIILAIMLMSSVPTNKKERSLMRGADRPPPYRIDSAPLGIFVASLVEYDLSPCDLIADDSTPFFDMD
jgi:hypothetical protein